MAWEAEWITEVHQLVKQALADDSDPPNHEEVDDDVIMVHTQFHQR